MTDAPLLRTVQHAAASRSLAAVVCLLLTHWAGGGELPIAAGQTDPSAAQEPRGAPPEGLSRQIHTWLEQRVRRELDLIGRCADLTSQQIVRIEAAAETCLDRLSADVAQQPQSLKQAGSLFMRVDGRFVKMPVDTLVVDRLSAAVASELTDEQRAAYRREADSRARFRRQANVAAMLVLLDGQLHLSAEQRDAVSHRLLQDWRDAEHFDLPAYLTHRRCVPEQLPELLHSALDPSQQPVWITLHAVDYWRRIDRHAPLRGAGDEPWLEQMLLQSSATAQSFQQGLIAQRDALLRRVDAECDLAPAQQDELRLAGRGDVKRFFDRAAVLRYQLHARAADPGRWVRADQDRLLPLQQTLDDGIFARGSLFQKVLAHRLSAEQAGRWQQAIEKRAAMDHAAQLRLWVATLDDQLPMLQSQRLPLLELLERETRPMPVDIQYAQYVLIYQAAAIPANRLRAIFDEGQLATLDRVFRANQSAEIFLRQNGFLPTAEFQDGEDD